MAEAIFAVYGLFIGCWLLVYCMDCGDIGGDGVSHSAAADGSGAGMRMRTLLIVFLTALALVWLGVHRLRVCERLAAPCLTQQIG